MSGRKVIFISSSAWRPYIYIYIYICFSHKRAKKLNWFRHCYYSVDFVCRGNIGPAVVTKTPPASVARNVSVKSHVMHLFMVAQRARRKCGGGEWRNAVKERIPDGVAALLPVGTE